MYIRKEYVGIAIIVALEIIQYNCPGFSDVIQWTVGLIIVAIIFAFLFTSKKEKED